MGQLEGLIISTEGYCGNCVNEGGEHQCMDCNIMDELMGVKTNLDDLFCLEIDDNEQEKNNTNPVCGSCGNTMLKSKKNKGEKYWCPKCKS